ncbi:MAG: MscL family protein [Afipia sp.]|nr:MscL family protein [Afipia sp.]
MAGIRLIKPAQGGRSMLKEFKEFVVRPGLIESAVGLVMALATAALIAALVEKIIMPIVGIIFGQPNFDSVMIATINNSEIMFGAFLTALVTFVSIAFAVFFFVVKPYQAYLARTATAEEEPAGDQEDLILLREIRDALKR